MKRDSADWKAPKIRRFHTSTGHHRLIPLSLDSATAVLNLYTRSLFFRPRSVPAVLDCACRLVVYLLSLGTVAK